MEDKYAIVYWTANDLISKAQESGLKMSLEEAEEWLERNAHHIENVMVDAGWHTIESLLRFQKGAT